MSRALSVLTSPAAGFGVLAALVWAPATGFPTWPAVARGRLGCSAAISLIVGLFVYLLAGALGAPTGR
jgi:hypothetical protein